MSECVCVCVCVCDLKKAKAVLCQYNDKAKPLKCTFFSVYLIYFCGPDNLGVVRVPRF